MAEQAQPSVEAGPVEGSPVYPPGSRVNERGHLEVAGCDVVELVAEHGTPAYIYAEDDMRARARAYREAFERRTGDFEVLFASKSLPCTAAYRLFAEEGLSVDVASGGELHMALRAGFDPGRIHMHGNNKSDEEILLAARAGVRHLILDSFDEIERCERLLEEPQDVLVRVTPGIKPSTHSYVQTGQLDSKFGFGLEDGLAARAIEAVLAAEKLNLVGLHAHIGSQIFELEPYTLAIRAIGELAGDWCRVVNVGGGLGIAYPASDEPPA
ncbi:MAG TPA: diaminopimelate decarboxylase, partial [Solirubrobacterales bacterium]|nr:diaminopimelate decarboxylase [Solirubrobacterales bacterium]